MKFILTLQSALFSLFFLFAPFFILHAETIQYHTLAPIKNGTTYVNTTETIDEKSFGTYLNNMYKLGIALCTGLAVIMIIIGGIQYVSSDAWSKKTDGKDRIIAALFGLLIAFGSYALLNTINPQILNTELKLASIRLEQIPLTQGQNPTYGGVNNSGTEAQRDPNLIDYGEPTTGQVSSDNLSQWGDPRANNMQDQVINGRQTYYAPGETHSDSNTDAGLGAFGKLVEGTPTTVGSAASVYYPAGTLVEVNGIKYIIDDNNLVKQKDGSFKPANNVLTNNYTVDIFTRDTNKANNTTTRNDMKVLYVPTNRVSGSDINNIRNNPAQYINGGG